jgi:hypothetical protein
VPLTLAIASVSNPCIRAPFPAHLPGFYRKVGYIFPSQQKNE